MLILAFDTTLSTCSAAIYYNGQVMSHEAQDGNKGHSEVIMPMIDNLMQKSQIEFSDFDLFATATGPGSYTGIRVCIALARGFKLALKKPAVGFNTLQIIAQGARRRKKSNYDILVVNEAMYEEVYFQMFSSIIEPKNNLQRCDVEKIIKLIPKKQTILTGTASMQIYNLIKNKSNIILDISETKGVSEPPDAVDLACLANEVHLSSKDMLLNNAPNPLYMHQPYEK